MYISTNQEEFELQVFNGKEYEPLARGKIKPLQGLFETMHSARRIVLPGKHSPKPRYTRPRGGSSSGYSRQEVIRRYLEWALAKGLKRVTVYRDDTGALSAHCARYIEHVSVPVADFLGPSPAAELEE